MSEATAADRTALQRFLADTGEWPRFIEIRDRLQDAGTHTGESAWHVAAAKYEDVPGFPDCYKRLISTSERVAAQGLPEVQTFAQIHQTSTALKVSAKVKEKLADESWESLLEKVDPNKTAPEITWFRWAMNYVDTKPGEIDVEDVPCRGALSLIRRMARNDNFYQNVATQVMSRLMPDKKTLEYESRFQDDGRQDLERLAEFEQHLIEQES